MIDFKMSFGIGHDQYYYFYYYYPMRSRMGYSLVGLKGRLRSFG